MACNVGHKAHTCLCRHTLALSYATRKGWANRQDEVALTEGRAGRAAILRAFKRPAPAVWGNGLWGSVGGAGRSYD
jgi:hypothetical protein